MTQQTAKGSTNPKWLGMQGQNRIARPNPTLSRAPLTSNRQLGQCNQEHNSSAAAQHQPEN